MRSARSFIAPLALVAACALAPRDARADEADAEQANALLRQGLALVDRARATGDRGPLELACARFRESYVLAHGAKPLFNLALAEKRLGRLAEATHHFRQVVALPAAEPDVARQAGKAIGELLPKVGSLRIHAPPGSSIRVDGEAIDDTPPATEVI
ncbi:MAG: hypothetical protein JOZ69_09065, partial [Myxococcales bacterium]|nr:hypothetical protein [Myxococcales bacterium]